MTEPANLAKGNTRRKTQNVRASAEKGGHQQQAHEEKVSEKDRLARETIAMFDKLLGTYGDSKPAPDNNLLNSRVIEHALDT